MTRNASAVWIVMLGLRLTSHEQMEIQMIKALYLATLADRTWWAGLLQLAVGIYIALMGVFVTFYFAAEMFQLFRD